MHPDRQNVAGWSLERVGVSSYFHQRVPGPLLIRVPGKISQRIVLFRAVRRSCLVDEPACNEAEVRREKPERNGFVSRAEPVCEFSFIELDKVIERIPAMADTD